MSDVTIWHNPRCSNARETLALIRAHGIEPRVVDYLQSPQTRAELLAVLAAAGLAPRDLLRSKEQAYADLGLADTGLPDRVLVDAMLAHPELINRPVVITPRGVRLCRPPERVLDILP